MTDLRKLRLSNLTSPQYSHILWALYWAFEGIVFAQIELLRPVEDCTPMWCPLDDRIPFNEWFLIPYLFWFVFLVGMNFYLILFDPKEYRRFMKFVALTYTATLIIYLIYPTSQNLRPEVFPRDNILTHFMAKFYAFDTNTNVCPSLHVVGSMAVAFAAWHTERFSSRPWKLAFLAVALLISISTVFVKQHSAVDVVAAFLLCGVGYTAVYKLPALVKKFAAEPQRA